MKKISYLQISAIIVIQTVTTFFGISVSILKEGSGINSWLSALISYIIGIIPLLAILYISNYHQDLKLNQKINSLFGDIIGLIINIFLSLIFVILAITIFYNINNFILSQFLYRTPFIISCTTLMILIIYTVNKGINVITKAALLLLALNITLYTINITSLIKYIDITNFLPLLKENNVGILPTSIKIACINYLPLLTILTIPKNDITNKKKYSKIIIIAYILGALISFGLVVSTFGVLGIDLVKTFEYSEYIVLRKVKLLGFLERIENIISLQWIIGSYIYITMLIHNISESIPYNKHPKIKNIILGILIITLTLFIFKDNTIFDIYIKNIFPYIVSSLTIIYILLIIKIYYSKKVNQYKKT